MKNPEKQDEGKKKKKESMKICRVLDVVGKEKERSFLV